MNLNAATSAPRASRATAPLRIARWVLWDGLRETWRQAKLGWITIPAAAKVRYAATLSIGLFVCLTFSAAITFTARWWAPRGLAAWDHRVLLEVNSQKVLSPQAAVLLESFGNFAYLIPLTAVCAIVAARRRKPLLAIAFIASYVLVRPIIGLGWWIWDRPRPTLILDGKLAPPLHSFPSAHVALALSVYGIIAFLWIRASRSWLERGTAIVLLLAIVSVTGIARVRLGVHWPSDIIAGFIIGVLWLTFVLRAIHRSGDIA